MSESRISKQIQNANNKSDYESKSTEKRAGSTEFIHGARSGTRRVRLEAFEMLSPGLVTLVSENWSPLKNIFTRYIQF